MGLTSRRIFFLLVVLSLALAACGSSDADPNDSGNAPSNPEASYPVTVEGGGVEVTISEPPESIVSISPTSTEMLFAIGAGDQVIAVDDQSNYPPEAPMTDLSGFEPNIEAIASYEPDLVLASDDTGGLVKSLDKIGIPVLLQPAAATFEDVYAQIEQLGAVTDHGDEAGALVSDMRSEIDSIVESVGDVGADATYYHELDPTYFTVTSETFIGQVYGLFDLGNIADEVKGAGSGYPQLSPEYIIQADPDLIFLADTKCCDESSATLSKRPGWDHISAVQNDAIVELDDDVASRWGPRIVDLVETVAEAVAALGEG